MSIFTKIGAIFKKKFVPYKDRIYLDANKKPRNTAKPPTPPLPNISAAFYKNGKKFYVYPDGSERSDDGAW
jgi:hypothetical protein